MKLNQEGTDLKFIVHTFIQLSEILLFIPPVSLTSAEGDGRALFFK